MYSYNVFYGTDLFKHGNYAVFSQCTSEPEHATYVTSALKRFKSKHYSEVLILVYDITDAGLNVITNEVYQNPLKKLIEINTQAKTAGPTVVLDDEPDMFDDEPEEDHDN